MRSVDLVVRILGDAKGASKAADQASGKMATLERGVGKLAKPAAIVGTALAGMGIVAVKAASDLQQSTGAVEAVFGKAQGAVIKYSETSATRMGLATSAYQQYAALTGTALQNAGFSAGQAASETDKLMQQAADNAALYGGTTTDAVEAINAAVARSEFDPIEKYGVSLNMASVNAELAKRGQDKLTGAAMANAKAQVILSQIYGKGAKAQGQYGREADSLAGRMQTTKAEVANAAAAIGTAFLPVVSEAAHIVGNLAGVMGANAGVTRAVGLAVAGLAAAVLLTNGAFKAYAATMAAISAVQKAYAAVQLALRGSTAATAVGVYAITAAEKARTIATALGTAATNASTVAMNLLKAAFLTSPWGVVIVGIMLIVGAFILAYQKSETFRNIVQGVMTAVSTAATAVGNWLKSTFASAWAALQAGARVMQGVVSAVFAFVSNVAGTVASGIGAVFRVYFVVVSTVVRAYINIVVAIIQGVLTVARAVTSGVAAVFRSAFALVSSVGRSAGSAIGAVFGGIGNVGRSVASAVGSVFRAAFGGVSAAGRAMGGVVSGAFSALTYPVRALANLVGFNLGGAFRTIAGAAQSAGGAIRGAIGGISAVINGAIGAVRSLIGWLSRIKVPSISLPFGIGGASQAAPAAALSAGPMARMALASATSPAMASVSPRASNPWTDLLQAGRRAASDTQGGDVTNVYVTGALDPEAVARQIRSILTRSDRRSAGVRIGGAAA